MVEERVYEEKQTIDIEFKETAINRNKKDKNTWLLLMGRRTGDKRYLSIFENDNLASVIANKRVEGYTFIMSPSLAHIKTYLDGNEYGMKGVLSRLNDRMHINDVKSFFKKLVSMAEQREFDLFDIEIDEEGYLIENGDEDEDVEIQQVA